MLNFMRGADFIALCKICRWCKYFRAVQNFRRHKYNNLHRLQIVINELLFYCGGAKVGNVISFLNNNLPWVWLAVAIVCIVIETFTLTLTTIWFAIGGVIMVFLAFIPIPFAAQLFIFVVISLALLIFTRPVIKNKVDKKKIATNYERIIGKTAVVTKKITALEKGAIKINGIEWSASVHGDVILEKGSTCTVEDVEGVTAYVKRN